MPAPLALVRYWTLRPSAAAFAVDGSAVSAATPMATAMTVAVVARNRLLLDLIVDPSRKVGVIPGTGQG
ncbi:hypothetical protein, partial [Streptomyces sp. RP5T]|uniref:hypothetical protein n=1 Tax=Streptomyces sp. RP5T TaxID=2490848 RepID=UPI0021AD6A61